MQGTKGAYSNEPESKKVRKRQHKKPLIRYWGGGKWRLREDEEGSRQHVLIEIAFGRGFRVTHISLLCLSGLEFVFSFSRLVGAGSRHR